jgi:hypothetical protein
MCSLILYVLVFQSHILRMYLHTINPLHLSILIHCLQMKILFYILSQSIQAVIKSDDKTTRPESTDLLEDITNMLIILLLVFLWCVNEAGSVSSRFAHLSLMMSGYVSPFLLKYPPYHHALFDVSSCSVMLSSLKPVKSQQLSFTPDNSNDILYTNTSTLYCVQLERSSVHTYCGEKFFHWIGGHERFPV